MTRARTELACLQSAFSERTPLTNAQDRLFHRSRQVGYADGSIKTALHYLEHGLVADAIRELKRCQDVLAEELQ